MCVTDGSWQPLKLLRDHVSSSSVWRRGGGKDQQIRPTSLHTSGASSEKSNNSPCSPSSPSPSEPREMRVGCSKDSDKQLYIRSTSISCMKPHCSCVTKSKYLPWARSGREWSAFRPSITVSRAPILITSWGRAGKDGKDRSGDKSSWEESHHWKRENVRWAIYACRLQRPLKMGLRSWGRTVKWLGAQPPAGAPAPPRTTTGTWAR